MAMATATAITIAIDGEGDPCDVRNDATKRY
jgi:hypothetical protein